MTLGEKIVFYRERLNLSQKALAEKIGITPTRLNYYEKDKRSPDVEMIKQLSETLGVSGDDLLGTMWAKEKTPVSNDTEDDAITVEEMERFLRAFGFISDNRSLTEKDVKFVSGIFDLLDAWFGS